VTTAEASTENRLRRDNGRLSWRIAQLEEKFREQDYSDEALQDIFRFHSECHLSGGQYPYSVRE